MTCHYPLNCSVLEDMTNSFSAPHYSEPILRTIFESSMKKYLISLELIVMLQIYSAVNIKMGINPQNRVLNFSMAVASGEKQN